MTGRCYLVHALATEDVSARRANDRLDAYVADGGRGLAVWHGHSVPRHGGAVVFDVRSNAEPALLRWQRRGEP